MFWMESPRVGIERNPNGRLVIALESPDLPDGRIKTSPKVDSPADKALARALMLDQLTRFSNSVHGEGDDLISTGELTPGSYAEEWRLAATWHQDGAHPLTLIVDAGNTLLGAEVNDWDFDVLMGLIRSLRTEVPEIAGYHFLADNHELISQLRSLQGKYAFGEHDAFWPENVEQISEDLVVLTVRTRVALDGNSDAFGQTRIFLNTADLAASQVSTWREQDALTADQMQGLKEAIDVHLIGMLIRRIPLLVDQDYTLTDAPQGQQSQEGVAVAAEEIPQLVPAHVLTTDSFVMVGGDRHQVRAQEFVVVDGKVALRLTTDRTTLTLDPFDRLQLG